MTKKNQTYDCDCPPVEHFLGIGEERLNYLEDMGRHDLADRINTFDLLATDARKTLTVYFAGIGACLGYVMHLLNTRGFDFLTLGIAITCAWLMFCGYVVIFKCIKTREVPALFNTPGNLFDMDAKKEDMSIEVLKAYEISFLCEKSNKAQQINLEYARHLNRSRCLAAIGTPIVFTASTGLFYFIQLIINCPYIAP